MTLRAQEEPADWILSLFEGTNPERARFEELIKQHWVEIASTQKVRALNVGWQFYTAIAKVQGLLMCTARDDEEMVGYYLAIILPDPHCQHIKNLTEDSHFVQPEYQRRGLGRALVRTMEAAAIDKGCLISKVRTKKHRDNGAFWREMGYTHIEDVYQKVLRPKV